MAKARYDAVRIAKELGYSAETIRKLTNATTETEIVNILVDARRHANCSRAAKLKRMHEAIIDNGDEELYEIWIRDGIPDEPEDVDFFDIAMDEQSYMEICDLYKKLAKHF